MPFQINSSKLFLTYPQCKVTKEDALEFLTLTFAPKEYIIAHELHKNGDDHLHVYLSLPGPIRTTNPHFADLPNSVHGNYQGCRSAKNVIKYCTKAEDYLSNMDVSALLQSRSNRRELLGSLLDKRRTLVSLVEEFPEYLYGYSKLKLDYTNFLKDKEDVRLPLPMFLPNPWSKVLPSKKKCKKRHYWLYSDRPNVGKTYHFALPIFQTYKVHLRTGCEPYWNLRGDEEAVILDEYNSASFKFYMLNGMCDGTYSYRIFQGGVIELKTPLIVVLSNLPISALYPNMNELLYARFNEIKLD